VKRILLAVIAASAFVAVSSASASVTSPIKINFSADTAGPVANGFTSSGIPQVSFYDTIGADLAIYNSSTGETHGNAIIVQPDDASALEIRISKPTTGISMAFGNDDPSFADTTDKAQLTLFRGSTQVARTSVHVNANDLMDQTISESDGPLFNRAVFQYVTSSGAPLNLIEAVDNIHIKPLCTIAGTEASNILQGTGGTDVICGGGGADLIFGGRGNDLIFAGVGADKVEGQKGADTIHGGFGRDTLLGGRGPDILLGENGNDHLDGGRGTDICNGGPGTDVVTNC
jgi:Ca2+-binding RTX toxin-like protein